MMYIINEIKTLTDGNVETSVNTYNNRTEAEQKYYLLLSNAIVSDYPKHCIYIFTNTGIVINSAYFEHDVNEE